MSLLKTNVDKIVFKQFSIDEELRIVIVKMSLNSFPVLLKLRTSIPNSVDIRPGFGFLQTPYASSEFSCLMRPTSEQFDGKIKVCYLDAPKDFVPRQDMNRQEFNEIYEMYKSQGCEEKYLLLPVKKQKGEQISEIKAGNTLIESKDNIGEELFEKASSNISAKERDLRSSITQSKGNLFNSVMEPNRKDEDFHTVKIDLTESKISEYPPIPKPEIPKVQQSVPNRKPSLESAETKPVGSQQIKSSQERKQNLNERKISSQEAVPPVTLKPKYPIQAPSKLAAPIPSETEQKFPAYVNPKVGHASSDEITVSKRQLIILAVLMFIIGALTWRAFDKYILSSAVDADL